MKTALQLSPFVVLLFILPFPGTIALRLASLAAAFLIVVISWRWLTPPPFPCKGAIALWAGVVIASLHFAIDPAYSLGEIRSEVGYALMAFVAFFAWTRDERQLRLSCLAVLAGFAVISGSALLGGYLRHGDWPSDVYYGGVGGVSNYLVTVGPVLALTVAMFGRRRSSKWWLALLGLLFLAVALLSAQRALWPAIGLQAALVWVWCFRERAVAVGAVRLALTGTILLALIGTGVYVSDQYRTGGNPESPLAMGKDVRPRVWKRVGEEILAHPLSGAGFGRGVMSKAYPALLPADDKALWYPHNGLAEGKVFWHPHNLVLNYGISAGVPGMVAVLALFAALAWRFWQLARRGERLARLSGLAGAAMVAGVLTRNMANDFFVRDGALLFWALAGVLFGYALRHGPTSGEDRFSAARTARRCGAAAANATFRPGSLGVGTRILAMTVGAVTLAGGVNGPSGAPEVMGPGVGDRGGNGAA
jgi:O-antigen ligase